MRQKLSDLRRAATAAAFAVLTATLATSCSELLSVSQPRASSQTPASASTSGGKRAVPKETTGGAADKSQVGKSKADGSTSGGRKVVAR